VSTWLAMDLTLTLHPVNDPAALLADLLDLRWQGLQRPLAFFPESSLAWVEQQGYGSAFEQAWSGRFNPVPEQSDLAVRIAFRGRDPIRDDPIRADFEHTAVRILRPMLACSETLRADR
jgi:exodeoxyribonuclease V gamma subunit